MKRLILILFALVLLGVVAPSVSYAQPREVPPGETTYEQAYVPCGTKDETDKAGNKVFQKITKADGSTVEIPGDGIVDNPCQFTHIIELARKIIMGWIIFGIIMATMGFSYAGLLYITAQGASEKISHAHSIFVKTFWGFFFMLSAWLIAYTMETIFLSKKIRCDSFLTTPEDRVKLGCPPTP